LIWLVDEVDDCCIVAADDADAIIEDDDCDM
jgi:hypothetical protein